MNLPIPPELSDVFKTISLTSTGGVFISWVHDSFVVVEDLEGAAISLDPVNVGRGLAIIRVFVDGRRPR
jgi:hypothetical protein